MCVACGYRGPVYPCPKCGAERDQDGCLIMDITPYKKSQIDDNFEDVEHIVRKGSRNDQ